MKIPVSLRAVRGGAEGSALPIVLALIVLLTIVVVAFLARAQMAVKNSSSSTAMTQSDLLAHSAIETIEGDLRDEMLAGAVNDPAVLGDGSIEPMQVSPTRRWAAVPARVLSSALDATDLAYANLVKQSLSAKPFYPGLSPGNTYTAKTLGGATVGKSRASQVSSSVPSLDGRFISARHWSASGLLGKDLTTAQVPDWIYVARSGPLSDGSTLNVTTAQKATVSNQDFVIGRYAYNIYDEGGLLNANVIGYPSSAANSVSLKGSPVWADASGILTQAEIDSLVAWRSQASSTLPSFLDYIRNTATLKGFTLPYTSGAKTDGYFISRGDLIGYWLRKNNVSSYSQLSQEEKDKLSKLTTFSIFSTTPWYYTSERPAILPATQGGNIASGSDSSTGKSWREVLNPYVPSIRVTGNNLVRYRKEAGTETQSGVFTRQVTAKAGEPLVNSRFPLSRLALITKDATAGTNSDIYRFFGLTRSSASSPWVYNHGASDRILSLAEVAKLSSPREPDFFELLQAAVDAGSLGKSMGPSVTKGGVAANNRDQVNSFNLMQIGANVIDQYDSDGYPTNLNFAGRDFYGIENLPYFTRNRLIVIQIKGAPLDADPDYLYGTFIQPEVWNPHDSVSLPAATLRPTRFRVVANSTTGYETQFSGTPTQTAPQLTDSNSGIEFSTANNSFQIPVLLSEINKDNSGAKASYARPPSSPDPGIFIGMRVNVVTPAPVGGLPAPLPTGGYNLFSSNDGIGITFKMQYWDGAAWRTYSQRENVSLNASLGSPDWALSALENPGSAYGKTLGVDPRTDRFSFSMYNGNQNGVGNYAFGQTLRPTVAAGYGSWTVDAVAAGAYGFTLTGADPANGGEQAKAYGPFVENRQDTGMSYYKDADGVIRGGDGYYDDGTQIGQMLSMTSSAGAYPSRPIILNRPFRSVAELGYIFRGVPFKNLDFFTPNSGDAALLDMFSIDEQPDDGLVAGNVSLNSRQPAVLAAVIKGILRTEGSSATTLNQTESLRIANLLTGLTSTTGPLINKSEIATQLMPLSTLNNSTDWRIKARREVVVRALADSTETSTWNLMVDLVVQTGRFPEVRTGMAPKDFLVSSEKRYWVHLAIDRTSGKVISSMIETANE